MFLLLACHIFLASHIASFPTGFNRTGRNISKTERTSSVSIMLSIPAASTSPGIAGKKSSGFPPYSRQESGLVLSQVSGSASLGIRQSPRGDKETVPTFGPSGTQVRLNCAAKNLCKNVFKTCSISSLE